MVSADIPEIEDDGLRLIQADVSKALDLIDNETVQLVLTSPPYNLRKIYPGKRHSAKKGEAKAGKPSGNPLGKNPSDFWTFSADDCFNENPVWEIPNVKANHPEQTIHPCQFPHELAERCVLAFSNEGDTVLDPFIGAGTGVIYPAKITDAEREKFEARLFLEINSTQTNAKSQLKQAIGLVLEPFATESIAARVLSLLAKTGPLNGVVEQYFFDTDKLKTSSIVSFGLRPLVKTSGNDSLFAIWEHVDRDEVAAGKNDAALADYVGFCVETINRVLVAIRKNLSTGRWTTNPKVEKRVLATTYVNSFLITLRLLIKANKPLADAVLEKAFVGIDDFDFSKYHSSQYKRMAAEIVEKHFGIKPDDTA